MALSQKELYSMLEIFAIHDKKGGYFMTPAFCKGLVDAQRSIVAAARDPKSNLVLFADDYDLYRVGTWDDVRGTLIYNPQLAEAPEFMCSVRSLIGMSQQGGVS